jgi:hypothetical protein
VFRFITFSTTKDDDRQSSGYKLVVITFAGILAILSMYSAGVFAVNPAHYAYAQQQSLIGDVNIPVNVDVTLIAPININIQNAQICLQVGGGSCTQVVLNPTQTTYSPTTINLAQPTPTITPTPTTPTTTLAPTTTTAQTAPPPTTATPLTPPSTTTTTTNPPTSSSTPTPLPPNPTQNALSNAAPQAHIPPSPTQNAPSGSPSTSNNGGGGSSGSNGGGSNAGSSSGK